MQKIDKMLVNVKKTAGIEAERRKQAAIINGIARMTTGQLLELADDNTPDERLTEILHSVGCLHLLESG